MTIPLQSEILYGPIKSRRLGSSLGLNILPLNYKLCSFDCVYCQYGFTRFKASRLSGDESNTPSLVLIRHELEKNLQALRDCDTALDCITFSGNGEPTLHPKLGEIIDVVRDLQMEYYPSAQLVILSNASQVTQEWVRKALDKLDERIMKLDAGSLEHIRRFNRPTRTFCLYDVITGLQLMKDFIIQSIFFTGQLDNSSDEALGRWLETLGKVKPKMVQIYTIDRPPR